MFCLQKIVFRHLEIPKYSNNSRILFMKGSSIRLLWPMVTFSRNGYHLPKNNSCWKNLVVESTPPESKGCLVSGFPQVLNACLSCKYVYCVINTLHIHCKTDLFITLNLISLIKSVTMPQKWQEAFDHSRWVHYFLSTIHMHFLDFKTQVIRNLQTRWIYGYLHFALCS